MTFHVPKHFDLIPPYDRTARAHYWTVSFTYQLVDPGQSRDTTAHMDHENIRHASPVRCWYCKSFYGPAPDSCPGRPTRTTPKRRRRR